VLIGHIFLHEDGSNPNLLFTVQHLKLDMFPNWLTQKKRSTVGPDLTNHSVMLFAQVAILRRNA